MYKKIECTKIELFHHENCGEISEEMKKRFNSCKDDPSRANDISFIYVSDWIRTERIFSPYKYL